MSIAAAFGNALSGLTSSGRQAQTVSSNIANALTPGYGARETRLSPGVLGGVEIVAIDRRVDAALLDERRGADAELGGRTARAAGLERAGRIVGAADDPAALPGLIARFEGALVAAAADPASDLRLDSVAARAGDIAAGLNRAGQGIQAERLRADSEIAATLDRLSGALTRVDDLNARIAVLKATGEDTSTLKDLRQRELDGIADIVPIRLFQRENDRIAVMSTNGQILLDDRIARFEFTPSNAMSPGAMPSGLVIDGTPVATGEDGKLGGGRLAALFALRDTDLPTAQARLDGFAAELVARYADPGLDPTLPPGAQGLFTASPGGPGLSLRIAVNPVIAASGTGETWRLRDGIAAAAPGAAGDARLLEAMRERAATARVPADPVLGAARQTLGSLADATVATAARDAFAAREAETYSAARHSALREAELAGGVDTDAELQTLMLIEKSYAANARVIEAADAMLRRLMEI
ncbi:flagellar hook-associated protein FlgK [Palleronia sediminis]|uniref:Flagellar hook-associated protein 1 n=1 Tax=Palleronia sediminis TaxID=2547833 RepID=A0A4R6A2J5_9RHOB|nr:flagellar basal body rod C-terminal domain-containing protein [Palleronia sediminis]TDL75236.1 flagellar hook-associated protein FlgK [Palleronia sediminis]